jgi:glutathione S-transferase
MMILIGLYDSPFVRRVAIAPRLYGMSFEHRPWSTFGGGGEIAPYNPLRQVPTLVLDGGEALIESTAILGYLDELVGPEKAMIAVRGPERRRGLKICAPATGLADGHLATRVRHRWSARPARWHPERSWAAPAYCRRDSRDLEQSPDGLLIPRDDPRLFGCIAISALPYRETEGR